MEVGDAFIAYRPMEDVDIDGIPFRFSECRHLVIILDKPSYTVSEDGQKAKQKPLQEQLKAKNWLWVENLTKGTKHWLNTDMFELLRAEDLRGKVC